MESTTETTTGKPAGVGKSIHLWKEEKKDADADRRKRTITK